MSFLHQQVSLELLASFGMPKSSPWWVDGAQKVMLQAPAKGSHSGIEGKVRKEFNGVEAGEEAERKLMMESRGVLVCNC